MVELDLALFGHPEAGNLWENHAFSRLRPQGWEDAPVFQSVFKNKNDNSILTCYVDDFELQASVQNTPTYWKEIGKVIEFPGPHEVWGYRCENEKLIPEPEKATAHLGCRYRVTRVVRPDGGVFTEETAEMQTYLEALVEKFEKKYNVEVKPQQLPFLTESKVRRLEEEAEKNN